MDHFAHAVAASAVAPRWMRVLQDVARRVELGYEPVVVRGWMKGVRVLEALEYLGADIDPVERTPQWILRPKSESPPPIGLSKTSRYVDGPVAVSDFTGIVHVRLDGERFLVMRTDVDMVFMRYERSLALGVPSLEVGLRVARRIQEADEALRGTGLRLFGADAPFAEPDEVSEEDLVFAPDFRDGLLRYLDGFTRFAELSLKLRVAPNRGVLLVGAPGTGKTFLIRRLMTRFGAMRRHLFISDPTSLGRNADESFKALLRELARIKEPAVVVVEDVDRLFEQGSVSPQLFLNVLDGMLPPTAPTLWVATSNYPDGLEANLLDRPGRFDRVVVFPRPGMAERARLARRYAPWPLDGSVVGRLARATDGLTGAHIREICIAAALEASGDSRAYPECLEREAGRVRRQHEEARAYGRHEPGGAG